MRCLKAFSELMAARDPDRQTAEIQIRVALMNPFNAVGTAEIVRVAWPQLGKGKSASGGSYATCITAPRARGIFRSWFWRVIGSDMYPASLAAISVPRARMVFADQAPNQCRVLEGTLLQAGFSDTVSRPLRQTSPCPLSLRRPRDRRWLTPP